MVYDTGSCTGYCTEIPVACENAQAGDCTPDNYGPIETADGNVLAWEAEAARFVRHWSSRSTDNAGVHMLEMNIQGYGIDTPAAGAESAVPGLVNVPEALRRYSSTFNNDAIGGAHAQSMLDSPQAWNPLSNPGLGEWVQMDLGSSRYVAQVVTQGRADVDQRVTQYTVQHSMDGITFTEVAAVFEGNTDRSTQVFATLPEPVLARYVRVVPQACVARCAMRAAVMEVDCPGDSAGGDVMGEQVAGDEAVAVTTVSDLLVSYNSSVASTSFKMGGSR